MEKMTLGAIRWDAWYGSIADNDPGFQVQRSLSPSEFHFRAPFFARVTEENKISVPEYTQETFDREMEYAIDAGIDYFAYVWYGNPGHEGLSLARTFHTVSKYRSEVKMCACLDSNAIRKDYAREGISALFKTDFYKKVFDNRPLVYFFGLSRDYEGIKEDIKFYKDYCIKENMPLPFFVIMDFSAEECERVGGDAISNYCIWGSDGMSFKAMHERAVNQWESLNNSCVEKGLQYIPTVTSGWSNLPRHKNPVTWIKGDLSRSYAQYATGEDVLNQVNAVKDFLKEKAIPVNSAIVYAWNEHDEGGWICPTIKVDENGDQLFDENGNPLINDERLQAVKRALKG